VQAAGEEIAAKGIGAQRVGPVSAERGGRAHARKEAGAVGVKGRDPRGEQGCEGEGEAGPGRDARGALAARRRRGSTRA
jgi:hypothetical protein